MATEPEQKPPVSFGQILTEPLIEGLPGNRARLARRKSFVVDFFKRFFRRSSVAEGRRGLGRHASTLENTKRTWNAAVHGYKSKRVDSLVRCISSIRQPIDAILTTDLEPNAREAARQLTARAWMDVRSELYGRLEKIDERIERTDPERTPDSYHWMQAAADPASKEWNPEQIRYLADEIRQVYGRLVWARGNLKFIALYVDDLRWLADFGAPAGESLTAVPTNRSIRKRLEQLRAHKTVLNDHVRQILALPFGAQVERAMRSPQG